MKKSLLLIVALLAMNGAKAQWSLLSTIDSSLIYAVEFVNEDTGFVFGHVGAIYKSTNGGSNWAPQNSGSGEALVDVAFFGSDTGYVASDNQILKTTNGGSVWVTLPVSLPAYIRGMVFTDHHTAFVTTYDSSVYKTINAGASWNLVLGLPDNYRNICFPTADTGYVFSNSGDSFYKTVDAGASWTSYGPITAAFMYTYCFPTSLTGYGVGVNGTIIKTIDGGMSWTTLNSGTTVTLRAIAFTSQDRGCVGGWEGTMLSTPDGGLNWILCQTDTNYVINDIQFINDNIGYATGIFETGGGLENCSSVVYKTSNGGQGWNSITNGEHNYSFSPNPVEASIVIRNAQPTQDAQIFIYGIQGQLCLVRPMNQEVAEIDLSGFAPGLYVIRIQSKDADERMKFIKR